MSQQALRDVSLFLAQNREVTTLRIEGHTSNRGTLASSLALSRDRAVAIRDDLIQLGVEGERLVAVAFGNLKPIADNATAAGRALNDRVEIRVGPAGEPSNTAASADPSSSPAAGSVSPGDAIVPERDDAKVGVVDKFGGFYGSDGAYYDRFGGHYDRDGYESKDGSYKTRCGVLYDAKSKKVLNADGSKRSVPRSAKSPDDKKLFIRILCAAMEEANGRK